MDLGYGGMLERRQLWSISRSVAHRQDLDENRKEGKPGIEIRADQAYMVDQLLRTILDLIVSV